MRVIDSVDALSATWEMRTVHNRGARQHDGGTGAGAHAPRSIKTCLLTAMTEPCSLRRQLNETAGNYQVAYMTTLGIVITQEVLRRVVHSDVISSLGDTCCWRGLGRRLSTQIQEACVDLRVHTAMCVSEQIGLGCMAMGLPKLASSLSA